MNSNAIWSKGPKRNRAESFENLTYTSWLINPPKRANSVPPYANNFFNSIAKSAEKERPTYVEASKSLSSYRKFLSTFGDYDFPKEYCDYKKDTRLRDIGIELKAFSEITITSLAQTVDRVDKLIEDDKKAAASKAFDSLIAARKEDIPNEDKVKLRNSFGGPNDHKVVIDKFSVEMTKAKIACLAPHTWLNDEVINFYMLMLMDRDEKLTEKAGGESVRRSSFYFNSFLYSKLTENGVYKYGNVQRWTKKFDPFQKEKIFIPINISNAHWTMAVIFIQKKELHYYDSMSGSGQRHLNHLKQWLEDEAKKRNITFDKDDWTSVERPPNVPQQKNGVDCGVFSIVCADFLSDDLPLSYSQDEMLDFRVRIGCAILRGNITY